MFTVKQAAQKLNVSSATVYALIQTGALRAHRIGVGRGVIRVKQEDIDRYLATCQVAERQARPRSPHRQLKHIKL